MTTSQNRVSSPSTLGIVLDRWSPRAFTDAPISWDELSSIIEAARWAPSAYNSQPWRFLVARKGTPEWETFLSWLIPFNQSWASNASALVYIASRTVMLSPSGETVPATTHEFDAGAASMLLHLQANHLGWATHAMSGFDAEAAKKGLAAPDEFKIHAAVAIGRQGPAELLPEGLRPRETPSGRAPLATMAWEGPFKAQEG
ncbi:nitroreductase [Acetobacter nitrogenifigens DSM 23921 = NBRC 105050]|uniref:Nitroreductase n=1 Tax=Acetobacter nitrogenifigens DSM 23921 = NBRC 105050 TaxID=1120919 RepID=A0A511X6P7_9PROT|nr:nitroreductase family protein [Acetobacter nitrogenifigens]GBQ98904.1 nitroreductase [Acetobacter nitrogenifigens DSM 23921 = NBRC 105050]GEN58612.1 nitroreductase [Acetobacter nitrogenifigens DSM 23921 = NBRC 105050]